MKRLHLAIIIAGIMLTNMSLQSRHFFQPHQPALTRHLNSRLGTKSEIHAYSAPYMRTAHRAFKSSHGFSTHTLSGLYFGSDEFRLSHMFKDSIAPLDTQYYTPYIRILKMRPRVQYSECGTNLGLSTHTYLRNNKVRVGMRVEVPFIRRELERKDQTSRDTAPTKDLVNEQSIKINKSGGGEDDYRLDRAFAYRLDFIEALAKDTAHNSAISYGANDTIQVFDESIGSDGTNIGAAVIYSPEGIVPRGENVGTSHLASGATDLPATLSGLSKGVAYRVAQSTDYSATADAATKTVAQRTADQDLKASTWVVPTFENTSNLQMSGTSRGIRSFMADAIKDFNANHLEWFADRGYLFESDQVIGIGDTTIEFNAAYEHSVRSNHEGSIGVILPTANGSTKSTSPYVSQLGHRNHFVLFGGASFTSYLGKGLTLNMYGKGNVALPAIETRCAMATGSQLKNLGPAQTATTSWQFVNAGAWLTFEHPATSTITCSVGYQFFFKTKDSISFAQKSVESWLGKKWDNTYNVRKYSTANNFTPDAAQSALNTQMMSHTIALRTNYHVSRWMQLTFGGSYTVAGKNTPQIMEANAGCVIAF